jgi:hypothetical protein
MTTRRQPRSSRSRQQHCQVCPTSGWTPDTDAGAERLREELHTVWWSITPAAPSHLALTRHCGQCQPHTVYLEACIVCGDGPILSGHLAQAVIDANPQQLPQVVVDELARTGWRWATTPYATGWVCS